MSPAMVVLLLFAGLSEAAGRLLPVVARGSGVSRLRTVGLLLFGAVVDGAVFAIWPVSAWVLAVALPGPPPGEVVVWTPALAAPLLLAAVLAFPLLGPVLHLLLLAGVGSGLAAGLGTAAGLGRWVAGGCVAVAGIGLAVAVEAVRHLAARFATAGAPERLT
jgi:hypothetical protein